MKEDRISALQNHIRKNGRASIEELCSLFNISKNTIRRDINELEKQNYIKKVYGGVILNDTKTTEPFESREVKNKDEKQQIGSLASNLVEDGDIIYIDSGTTTMCMIPHLAARKNLTIITNNLHVITSSLPFSNLNIICTGGTFLRRTNSFIGIEAVNSLKQYNISKSFVATTGLSIEKGLTNSSSFEYDIKRYISENCEQIIVLADNSKFDRVSLMTYYDLKSIQVLVTDKEPDATYIKFFNDYNINLVIP